MKQEEDSKWIVVTHSNKKEYIGSGTFGVCRKIIATTDTSLIIEDECSGHCELCNCQQYNLPQIPQWFIEYFISEYNKGNIITEVSVEYERFKERHGDGRQFIMSERLKINSDNTINIKPIKNSWNKEEVIELFHKFNSHKRIFNGEYIDEWLNKNL